MALAPASVEEDVSRTSGRVRGRQPFYVSDDVIAQAETSGSVSVDLSIRPGAVDLAELRKALLAAPRSVQRRGGKAGTIVSAKVVREALTSAAADLFSRSFAIELGKVVDAYRVMLRESLAKGEDRELQAALNQARLQEKILASTSMADQGEACRLIGLSDANPSATMKRKEERQEILRFTVEGRPVYPLFQFDVEGRRIFPAMGRLIAMKPESWSDFRLLHWLTRPHLDMDSTPAAALGSEEAVVAAFEREIEPAVHG